MPIYYRPKRKFDIVKLEEIKPYIMIEDKEMSFLMAMLWLTGFRIKDMLSLRHENIIINYELEDVQIQAQTSKGGGWANPSFSFKDPFIMDLVIPYIHLHDDPLLKRGKRRYQQRLQQLNKQIHGDETSKYLTFHYLRHSRITHLCRVLRASAEEVKSWTGHKSSVFEDYIAPRKVERFKGRLNE